MSIWQNVCLEKHPFGKTALAKWVLAKWNLGKHTVTIAFNIM